MIRLLAVLALAAGATTAHAQPVRTVDVRLPGRGEVQRLALEDGSQVYGRVDAVRNESIVFTTDAGVTMTVPIERIVELRAVRGRIVGGELWREDPHASRLFGGPTARSVRRGHGYFTLHQIWIPSVQVGVTDRFSVGAATPLLPVFKNQPVAVTPKLQLFAGDRVQVAAGTIHLLNVDDNDIGIGYAVTTIGSRDNAVTGALGFGYNGDDARPVLMIGGEARGGRRLKWVTENWIWGVDAGFITGGVRVFGERFSADLGLVAPLGLGGFPLPVVSLTWGF